MFAVILRAAARALPAAMAMVLATLGLGVGCVTPSVPIPPPQPELMVFETEVEETPGFARFSYDAQSGYNDAVVYVFNRDLGEGIITTARGDGSVGPTAPFRAESGDDLIITFETDDQLASRCVTLAEGRSGSQFECSL